MPQQQAAQPGLRISWIMFLAATANLYQPPPHYEYDGGIDVAVLLPKFHSCRYILYMLCRRIEKKKKNYRETKSGYQSASQLKLKEIIAIRFNRLVSIDRKNREMWKLQLYSLIKHLI